MRYAVIEAPSNLGLTPNGVERLGDVLLANGLASASGRRGRDGLSLCRSAVQRDPQAGGTLNADGIAAWSPRLADAVGAAIDDGFFQWFSVATARSSSVRRSRSDGAGGMGCSSSTATRTSSSRRPSQRARWRRWTSRLRRGTDPKSSRTSRVEGLSFRRTMPLPSAIGTTRISGESGSQPSAAGIALDRHPSHPRARHRGGGAARNRTGHASRARRVLHPFRRRLPR